ncbi:UDP-N-acetylmuramoyl-L-alanine--D-glutamate ligase [Salinimonas marina]|uniref:UDP-N-acetylmuramoylalanine--D-glutamate ligase n=1 Tax=Salinimonas marina TaxID=2785918 RepID=A0A7S9DYM2_9ALTE|nr:UDP-N-acetylmuramoyl-L-alanine--D-glutamate ligase [Salinimonas marina]QPG06285.1 UDP-N-acetylmuramoyl-L-alanine--D-glutamate ligase [Salinimonas marina]
MSDQLNAKRIVVAGLGLSGQACLRFLTRQPVQLSVWDTRTDQALPEGLQIPLVLGEPPAGFWNDVDMVVVSPGLALNHPQLQIAAGQGVEIIGEIELFARFNQAPVLGITGSNGKTTVTLLTTHILNAFGINAVAAGNVGLPALDTLALAPEAVVLELSSFQLETTRSLALAGATILNISDDHLDRHKTLAAYSEAKQRIYSHAQTALCWRDQQLTYPLPIMVEVVEFGQQSATEDFGVSNNWITWQGQPVVDLAQVRLVGAHNILNIQAALGLAMLLGVTPEQAAPAVYQFEAVAHRCVPVSAKDGITWIDDSKATNAGATMAAIEGLGAGRTGKLILIAGGDAKGADLSCLKPYFEQYIDELVTLGRDGELLARLKPGAMHTRSMAEAVAQAHKLAAPGDTVLLSPACASLDMFNNYEHRAQVFVDAIEKGFSC